MLAIDPTILFGTLATIFVTFVYAIISMKNQEIAALREDKTALVSMKDHEIDRLLELVKSFQERETAGLREDKNIEMKAIREDKNIEISRLLSVKDKSEDRIIGTITDSKKEILQLKDEFAQVLQKELADLHRKMEFLQTWKGVAITDTIASEISAAMEAHHILVVIKLCIESQSMKNYFQKNASDLQKENSWVGSIAMISKMHSRGDVHSEYNTHDGRLDLVYYNRSKNEATIAEFKMGDVVNQQNKLFEALEQVKTRRYNDALIPYRCSKITVLGVVIGAEERAVLDDFELEMGTLTNIASSDLRALLGSRAPQDTTNDNEGPNPGNVNTTTPMKSKRSTGAPKSDSKTVHQGQYFLDRQKRNAH